MAASSPVSPPLSPRQSDISFTSVNTHLSAPQRKYSPPPIPIHASTSTISRDSHASTDDRPTLTAVSRPNTPFLESTSATRLPKARVFVHRDQRPDRPKSQTSHKPPVPRRPLTPIHLTPPTALPPPKEKRCFSDLHDAYRAQELRVQRSPAPAPDGWIRRRGVTDDTGSGLSYHESVPRWIPNKEMENWKPSPKYDPYDIEEEPNNRWATSLRQLSNLYKLKEKGPPCLRGSILDVQPPTLTERLGLGSLGGDRKHVNRNMRGRTAARGRMSKRKDKHGEWTRKDSPTGVAYLSRDDDGAEMGRDDYVGFLIEGPEEKSSRPRRRWLRFLRRSRE